MGGGDMRAATRMYVFSGVVEEAAGDVVAMVL